MLIRRLKTRTTLIIVIIRHFWLKNERKNTYSLIDLYQEISAFCSRKKAISQNDMAFLFQNVSLEYTIFDINYMYYSRKLIPCKHISFTVNGHKNLWILWI